MKHLLLEVAEQAAQITGATFLVFTNLQVQHAPTGSESPYIAPPRYMRVTGIHTR